MTGSDNGDTPLEPLGDGEVYRHIVVDLAEFRIQAGRSPHNVTPCPHKDLVYSTTERRIWCKSCERTVDSFDAFAGLARQFEKMLRDVQAKQIKVNEALNATVRMRATKALDHLWSSSGAMAPGCPHCRRGLLPEDFANGVAVRISRELEKARRRKDDTTP